MNIDIEKPPALPSGTITDHIPIPTHINSAEELLNNFAALDLVSIEQREE